jgi:antitoxin component YwqK of YwqJK toxin-antitoxin module
MSELYLPVDDGSVLVFQSNELFDTASVLHYQLTMRDLKFTKLVEFREDGSEKKNDKVGASVTIEDDAMNRTFNLDTFVIGNVYPSPLSLYTTYEDAKMMALYRTCTGEWKHYHPNGVLHCSGRMVENEHEGPWEFYYENGNLKARGSFETSEMVNEWKFYYESGQLYKYGSIQENRPIGEWKTFYLENEMYVDSCIPYETFELPK